MDVYRPTDWTKHPVHTAAMSGNQGEVERLLSQGADVNEDVFQEGTPLHVAICHCSGDAGLTSAGGHVEVIRLLLGKGANLHARRAFSGTPLHDAAHRGYTGIARLLIVHGADIDSKEDDHRRTPLHRAVAAGKEDMVAFLISKGAEVNAVADFAPSRFAARAFPDCGMTPLHVAAREGFAEIAEQLVVAGAATDVTIARTDGLRQADQGLTAFQLALQFKRRIHRKHEEQLQAYDKLLELLGTATGSGRSAMAD